jgi:hypothetical protein
MTGFTSNFSCFPDDGGLAVVVLTNAGHANPRRIGRRVAGLIDPKLVATEPAPIEDKEPAVTARVRDVLLGLHKGELASTGFTPELFALVEKELPDWKAAAADRGDLVSLDLIGREESGAQRTYRYRATYGVDKLLITANLNADGVIAGWRWEEE